MEVIRPERATGSFVGRSAELAQLLDALAPGDDRKDESESVSTVSGMGGIGKTALAVRAAALAAERGWFVGGVLLVDLRGYEPDQSPVQTSQVYESLLHVLGVAAEQIPGNAGAQATLYHLVLDRLADQGKRVLVVLDNVVDASDVRKLIPRQRLHRAVITTRDVLALPVATRVPLHVLTECEAVELLTGDLRRASHRDMQTEDPEQLCRLVRLCGLLPLAVKIVAAILADESALTVADLGAQLEDTESRLAGLAYGAPQVATVIDVSYRRLMARDPAAARLLALLTVNPGPDLSTNAAAALADTSVAAATVLLRALRTTSLLQYTCSGRWQLHDLVSLYARRHLDREEAGRATARLFMYYIDTAQAADNSLRTSPGPPASNRFGSRADALDWFDAERFNLTSAVAHAHDTGLLDRTVRLACLLVGYLSWRSHRTDLLVVTGHAADATTSLGRPRDSAIAWNNRGLALHAVRRFDEAIVAYKRALGLFHQLHDPDGEREAWDRLGSTLMEVRQFNTALLAHSKACSIATQCGDRHGQALALNNSGLVLSAARQFSGAVHAHKRAVHLFRELSDGRSEAMACDGLGSALVALQQFDEAIRAHERARELARELDDPHTEAGACVNLGLALRKARHFARAIAVLESARDIFHELGDLYLEGKAWTHLGSALELAGQPKDAIAAQQRACNIAEEVGDEQSQKEVWLNLGCAQQAAGLFEHAIAAFKRSCYLSRKHADQYGIALASYNIGNAYEKLRQFDSARRVWHEALAAFMASNAAEGVALVQHRIRNANSGTGR